LREANCQGEQAGEVSDAVGRRDCERQGATSVREQAAGRFFIGHLGINAKPPAASAISARIALPHVGSSA